MRPNTINGLKLGVDLLPKISTIKRLSLILQPAWTEVYDQIPDDEFSKIKGNRKVVHHQSVMTSVIIGTFSIFHPVFLMFIYI